MCEDCIRSIPLGVKNIETFLYRFCRLWEFKGKISAAVFRKLNKTSYNSVHNNDQWIGILYKLFYTNLKLFITKQCFLSADLQFSGKRCV